MVAWAGFHSSIPEGTLLCDGRSFNREGDYSDLFAVIGTAWGKGTSSDSTFNIPDGQGGIPKGVGCSDKYNKGKHYKEDADNKSRDVGSYQETAIRNIEGQFSAPAPGMYHEYVGGAFMATGGVKVGDNYRGGQSTPDGEYGVIFDVSREVPTGSSNRDNNFGINWIIYYK